LNKKVLKGSSGSPGLPFFYESPESLFFYPESDIIMFTGNLMQETEPFPVLPWDCKCFSRYF